MSEQFWTQCKKEIPATTFLTHYMTKVFKTNQQMFQFYERLDSASRTKANIFLSLGYNYCMQNIHSNMDRVAGEMLH